MGFILDKVIDEYHMIDTDAPTAHINRASVEEAITILRTLKIYRAREAFLYLSALNLLNAAIKQNEYKNELTYGFIKGKALLIAKIIITKYRYDNIRCYYDLDEKCLYIEVYGVVFSFHIRIEDPFLIETDAKAEKIIWPEIRLQRIAEPLFELAKTLYHQSKDFRQAEQ